jgi:formylglycine-generating enzyme required for sulfatase activity
MEISDRELTVAQVGRLLGREWPTGRFNPTHDTPANEISWYEAALACNALSELEGRALSYRVERASESDPVTRVGCEPEHQSRGGFRMPTIDEFAVACRAGSKERRFFGDSDTLLTHYVWYRRNTDTARPVGTRKPNALGLYDTLGNVAEWVEMPGSPPTPHFQDARGGSLTGTADDFDALRLRKNNLPRGVTDRGFNLGFRVARTVTEDRAAPANTHR